MVNQILHYHLIMIVKIKMINTEENKMSIETAELIKVCGLGLYYCVGNTQYQLIHNKKEVLDIINKNK